VAVVDEPPVCVIETSDAVRCSRAYNDFFPHLTVLIANSQRGQSMLGHREFSACT
jgi:hypothetical protein